MSDKVLVTGAEGFIGSHLVEGLLAEGRQVRAFVLYNYANSWGWLESLSPAQLREVEVVTGDVRDPWSVRQALQGVDTVFHLAALIAIPYSYQAPESYLDTNVRGTLNVLQGARDCGCRRVLVTSTSEVYGTARYVPIDERHPFQGQSPYSASKIAADRFAESFHRSFGLPVTIVRPFNTFGPRQSARAVIPTIITQLLSGRQELQLGSLTPTRDLVFVKDTVRGFQEISRAERTIGAEVNIATEREIAIGDLAAKLIALINPAARIVCDEVRVRPQQSEVERLLGSKALLQELTGWTPGTDFDTALAETVAWFRRPENLARYKADIYNV